MFKLTKNQKGFSLIEAMISAGIVAVGFAGVLTLVATSDKFMSRSIGKQKAQMIANQMMDIIEADNANIDSYTMDLTTCTDPGAALDTYLIRGYEWCVRLEDELGVAGVDNNRSISVTDSGTQKLVTILIEGQSQRVQVFMKRLFDS